MSRAFPGTIFDSVGRSLDAGVPNLTQDQLDEFPHRLLVARNDLAPVARVWLLDDGATFSAVHAAIRAEAVALVRSGKSVVILARCPEPNADVRDGLLEAAEMAEASSDVAGRA